MTKKEEEENDKPSEEEEEDLEKSIKLDTSELTKAVDDFTAAVEKMAALLTKEEEEDDEEDEDEEKSKKSAKSEDDENDDDDEDSEEKAKKAIAVLEAEGYKVDKLLKGGPTRPEGGSAPMAKAADSEHQRLYEALEIPIKAYTGGGT